MLDLRDHRAGDLATCGGEIAAGLTSSDNPRTPVRIDGVSQLPLVIELPSSPGLDPGCPTLCDNEISSDTVFGIHFAIEWPRNAPFAHIRVEPPWRIVSGNEGAPTLCDNGRPSLPELFTTCAFTYVKAFALVTDDPAAPPARAIIEADDVTSNEVTHCCMNPAH